MTNYQQPKFLYIAHISRHRRRRLGKRRNGRKGKRRRLTQAGVRFFRGEPRTVGGHKPEGACREREGPQPWEVLGPSNKSESESICIDKWNLYIYIPTPTQRAYITQKKNRTSLARSGEDGKLGPSRPVWD